MAKIYMWTLGHTPGGLSLSKQFQRGVGRGPEVLRSYEHTAGVGTGPYPTSRLPMLCESGPHCGKALKHRRDPQDRLPAAPGQPQMKEHFLEEGPSCLSKAVSTSVLMLPNSLGGSLAQKRMAWAGLSTLLLYLLTA